MKSNLSPLKGFYLILFISFSVAFAQEINKTALQVAATPERYRIGPGDVLDIRVYNRPQLSHEAVRVEGNGMIRMPLIDGDIQAACKTEGELAQDISTRYAKYYRNLPVDVFIPGCPPNPFALLHGILVALGRR